METRSGREHEHDYDELAREFVKEITTDWIDKLSKGMKMPNCRPLRRAIKLVVVEFVALTAPAAQRVKRQRGRGLHIGMDHVPWRVLERGLLAGLYMNTRAVQAARASASAHSKTAEEGSDGQKTNEQAVLSKKDPLSKNLAKLKTKCDTLFGALMWSKAFNCSLRQIALEVLGRYENVIKSLRGLQTARQQKNKSSDDDLVAVATRVMRESYAHCEPGNVEIVMKKIGVIEEGSRPVYARSDSTAAVDVQHLAALSKEDGTTKNAMRRTPCLYWINTGIKDADESKGFVFKMGYTNDLPRRLGEHIGTFGRQIKLHGFVPMPLSSLPDAETALFRSLDARRTNPRPRGYEKETELFSIPEEDYDAVKREFMSVADSFCRYTETASKISECNRAIELQKCIHANERRLMRSWIAKQQRANFSELAVTDDQHLAVITMLINAINLSAPTPQDRES